LAPWLFVGIAQDGGGCTMISGKNWQILDENDQGFACMKHEIETVSWQKTIISVNAWKNA
jgi:hypothetical protein